MFKYLTARELKRERGRDDSREGGTERERDPTHSQQRTMMETVRETYMDAWIFRKHVILVCIVQRQQQVVALLLGHIHIKHFI